MLNVCHNVHSHIFHHFYEVLRGSNFCRCPSDNLSGDLSEAGDNISDKHFSCPRKLSPHGIPSTITCMEHVINTVYRYCWGVTTSTRSVHVQNIDQVYPGTLVGTSHPPGYTRSPVTPKSIINRASKHMLLACLHLPTSNPRHIQTLFSDEFGTFSDIQIISRINYPGPGYPIREGCPTIILVHFQVPTSPLPWWFQAQIRW